MRRDRQPSLALPQADDHAEHREQVEILPALGHPRRVGPAGPSFAEVGPEHAQPSKSAGLTLSRQTIPAIRTWTVPPRTIGARNSAAKARPSAAARRSRISFSRFLQRPLISHFSFLNLRF